MDMQALKKRVLLDLLLSPISLIPAVAGISALLVSWAGGPWWWLTFTGICAILASLGINITILMLDLPRRINEAVQNLESKDQSARSNLLKNLQRSMARDRYREVAVQLLALYGEYCEYKKDLADREIVRQMDSLFDALVKQLERYCKVKKKEVNRRERLIEEIRGGLETATSAVGSFHTFTAATEESEVSRLRSELEVSLEMARRLDEMNLDPAVRYKDLLKEGKP
jgi:hypothetical protein